MNKDKIEYKILLVEDNPGDIILIEEYLDEHILKPRISKAINFKQAKNELTAKPFGFDAIFLDLSLPDKAGEDLIQEMLLLSGDTPIIILTGYSDMPFSIKSLGMGISDYMLKDSLTPFSLYKSLLHNINRRKYLLALEQSEKMYNDLFHFSPQPMWVIEEDSGKILDVNNAALREYGYTNDEFLNLNVLDIVLEDQRQKVSETPLRKKNNSENVVFERHKLKKGEIIDVEMHFSSILYNGKKSKVNLANNITETTLYLKAIENQNQKLKEIAWIQSHIVRAPLARMMGIIDLMKEDQDQNENQSFFNQELLKSAHELDGIIRDISARTEEEEIKFS